MGFSDQLVADNNKAIHQLGQQCQQSAIGSIVPAPAASASVVSPSLRQSESVVVLWFVVVGGG